MKKRIVQEDSEARSNVGVRNPFPLAEAILLQKGEIKERIDWTRLSTENARSILTKAFKIPYKHLFDPDPEYKSPLYYEPKVGSGVSHPCSSAVDDWIDDGDGWEFPTPPPPTGTNGLDIQQGCSPDCYFIAALTSFAWTNPASLGGGLDGGNHKYVFKPAPGTTIRTTKFLAVDASAVPTLVFATSTTGNVWASLYEKAYAIFRGKDATKPDIAGLGTYNPREALKEVTKFNTSSLNLISFGNDLEKIFTNIRTRGGAIASTGGKTKANYPMVAWTYPRSEDIPEDGDYAYEDDLIVANHAYSILGVAKCTIDGEEQNCVILRNPYGHSTGTDIEGVSDCTPAWFGDGFFIADGNFAMTLAAFNRYFEGFAFKA